MVYMDGLSCGLHGWVELLVYMEQWVELWSNMDLMLSNGEYNTTSTLLSNVEQWRIQHYINTTI